MFKFFGNLKTTAIKEAPTICTFITVGSMVAAIIFAIKDTPKAMTVKEKAEEEKGEVLTPIETVKKCIPCYWKTLTFAGISAFAAFNAHNIHKRRYAALLTAYSLSETARKEYEEEVKKYLGEKKEKDKIASAIGQKHVDDDPVTEKTKVIFTGNGESLFYEPISRQYFKDDRWKVEKKINKINERILQSDFVSFDEFLTMMGLDITDPKRGEIDGNSVGWGSFTTGLIDVDYTMVVSDEDQPCFSLVYRIPPSSKYMDLH